MIVCLALPYASAVAQVWVSPFQVGTRPFRKCESSPVSTGGVGSFALEKFGSA